MDACRPWLAGVPAFVSGSIAAFSRLTGRRLHLRLTRSSMVPESGTYIRKLTSGTRQPMSVSEFFFDTRTIQQMADGHEYARGEEYAQRGRVRNLILEEGVYRAYVHRASYYLVKVWHDGDRVRTTCSCNYSKRGICRHTAATMIAVLKRESSDREAAETGINLYEDGSFLVPQAISDPVIEEEVKDEADDPEEESPQIQSVVDLKARDIMSSPVGTLPADASVAEAWHLIQDREVRHVPIVSSDGTIHGVISDRDLLRDAVADAISPTARPLTERLVRDLVSPRLLTAGPDTEISQIARVLYEEHVGSLPIIDEKKNLVGLITRSDILRAIVEGNLLGES
jgi:CBS domain-containing protein